MTDLERLREKTAQIDWQLYPDLRDIVNQYDLALENALLKLKNRGVEIKDLKHRTEKIRMWLFEFLSSDLLTEFRKKFPY